jgi:hypothetical protein
VLACIGQQLGAHFGLINTYVGPVGWSALAAVVVGVPLWLYRRKRKRAAGH